jgi:hypothetical protein
MLTLRNGSKMWLSQGSCVKHETFKLLVHTHEWNLMNHETNSSLTVNNLSPSQEIPRNSHNQSTYCIIHINWLLSSIKRQFKQLFKTELITLHYTFDLTDMKTTSHARSVIEKYKYTTCSNSNYKTKLKL